MNKGWRNNPAWVEHYKKVEQERALRRMALINLDSQLKMLSINLKNMIKDNAEDKLRNVA